MERCTVQYPFLATLADYRDPNLRNSGKLEAVRSHAMELARSSVTEGLRELGSNFQGADIDAIGRKKEQLLVRLKRLLPGASLGLKAVCDERGEVTSDPAQMAAILRAHWSKIFSNRPIDENLLQKWLVETFPDGGKGDPVQGLPFDASKWNLRKDGVAKASQQAGNSMPGPDRIPYIAWKRLGDLGTDTLFEAATALQREDAADLLRRSSGPEGTEGDHDFNLGVCVACRRKKLVRTQT
jgi:hypothetical protein